MSTSAKEAIRAHFEHQALDAERLAKLERLIRAGGLADSTASGAARGARRRFVRRRIIRAAGALAGCCVLILAAAFWHSQTVPKRIALEVAKNHLALKPADIVASELSRVDAFFTHLDFKLVKSSMLSDANWSLKGARYCEILGVTAAQLRMVEVDDADGVIQTLYQVRHEPGWFSVLPVFERGEPPIEIMQSGLRILIWVEKGILFAMTHTDAPLWGAATHDAGADPGRLPPAGRS